MKFDVLILDHDDTCVNSTATIHYPAHLEIMKEMRPDHSPVDLDGWFTKNFHPGIMHYLQKELEFSREELDQELLIWRKFNEMQTPEFFPGIKELISGFRKAGGRITVVSHSEERFIRRFYREKAPEQEPDLIFGWNDDPEKRKPNPWPAREILKTFNIEPSRTLLIDDLRPGIDMAKALNIPTAGAGWGHSIPVIQDYMSKNTDYYFKTVKDLNIFLGIDSD